MKKLYVFDADGTLRRCTVPGQPCPNKPGEWELLPGVEGRLARIDWNITGLGILSNQGGIALGHLSEDMAYQLLCDTVTAATKRWPLAGSIFVCPHAPGAGCACRKPSPVGLRKIMERQVRRGGVRTRCRLLRLQVDDRWALHPMESRARARER